MAWDRRGDAKPKIARGVRVVPCPGGDKLSVWLAYPGGFYVARPALRPDRDRDRIRALSNARAARPRLPLKRRSRQTTGALGRLAQPRCQLVGELPRARAASSSCPPRARAVHARLAAEAEHVLRRHDRERARGERGAARSATSAARPGRARSRGARARRRASPTSRAACRCRACPCRRRPLRGGSRAGAGCAGPPPKPNCSTSMPGQSELVAQALDRRRDHAEILGDQRQRAELAPRGVEHGPPRAPAASGPARAVARARGHRPVGDEAAEVIDAREVDELERRGAGARSTSGSRGAAARASRRAGCPRAARRAERVGRRAGDDAALEQLGVRRVVGAAGADVDRDVADQPDAALARVAPQRAPLALEAHLVGERRPRRRSAPSRRSSRPARHGTPSSSPARRAPRARPAAPARPRTPRSTCTASPMRSGGPSGSTCHQDWPGGGEPVDERVRRGSEAPAGKRRHVEQDSARTGKIHDADAVSLTPAHATRPIAGRLRAG